MKNKNTNTNTNTEFKYALQSLRHNPYVRRERRQNMTNLPQRWVEKMFSNNIEALTPFVDSTHRIIDWSNLEIIVANKF